MLPRRWPFCQAGLVHTFEFDVDGGPLTVHRFGAPASGEPNLVVAVHGITGSAVSFRAVARHLPPGWAMVAPDLRGRGASATASGSGGLAGHARDVVALVEYAAAGRPVALVGHSMGAYIALLAAAARPELLSRLVLVDGGLPLPPPATADLDAVLAASLGPALARLSLTFESEQAYVDFFRAHPALGPHWNDDLEAYVRYDALPVGTAGAVRSRVREEAARVDGRDLLVGADVFAAALGSLAVPTLLLTAPEGMFGQPPGFLPAELVQRWRAEALGLRAELVDQTNHYTILLGAGAGVVAARTVDESGWPA